MRRDREDRIDPSKPALVVLYGATKRKHRPLTGQITVLGRNPGCDVGLVSPEVAPVHCVIVQLSDGWRIRDCSGRATRVNGKAIQDEPLQNGDVIQIGTFSFEAHLPPPGQTPMPAAPAQQRKVKPALAEDAHHVKQSRRRLGERAVDLRRKLHEAEQRERELAQRERDLEQLERRLRAAPRPVAVVAPSVTPEQGEAQARLDHRSEELSHYANHLRRQQKKLRETERTKLAQIEAERVGYEADLVRDRVEVEHERRDVAELRRHVEQRHVELEQTAALLEEELSREKEQLESDREQVARERAYLDEQRQDLVQLRADLERQADEGRPIVPATSQDTQLDEPMPDRLASARRLLRQLAERRQTLARQAGS